MENPALEEQLARLEGLIDWERRSRGASPAGTQGSGMRVTVEPARDLLARLGTPQRGLRVVHVAGTKGKGSVAALVAAGLEAQGLRTGVFASPHVESVRERVRIAGRLIEGEALAAALAPALDAHEAAQREGTPAAAASWFDVLTAAAVLAFARAEVTWAIVECGLGGRLDSTNALDGEVCVVTNVDLEHTEVLGDTHAKIAREKAGILKPGATLVTGVPSGSEAGAVVDARAAELGVPVLRPPLAGLAIEDENAVLAETVLEALGSRGVTAADGAPLATTLDAERRAAARLPGRLERRDQGGVRVVLDGAHVASSLARVVEELDRAEFFSPGPTVAVVGTGGDKDVRALLKVLAGRVDRVLCTSAGHGPARPPEQIRDVADGLGMVAETVTEPRVALTRALRSASPEGSVIIAGSLHLVGTLRPHLSPTARC